jgi:hypothetical protein
MYTSSPYCYNVCASYRMMFQLLCQYLGNIWKVFSVEFLSSRLGNLSFLFSSNSINCTLDTNDKVCRNSRSVVITFRNILIYHKRNYYIMCVWIDLLM